MDLAVRGQPIARRVHLHCRNARWRDYARTFPPNPAHRVLDVGVSPLVDLPGENHFLTAYPYPGQITAISNDTNLDPVRRAYPDITVETADALDLPFEDGAFDIVHSNAVLEHVGPTAEQVRFVAELTRVGRAGYISTPNRWFPFDSHTNLPLAHWLPRPLFLTVLRRLGRLNAGEEWITWLLSSRDLGRVAPDGLEFALRRQRLGGMTAVSTLVFRNSRGPR